MLSDEPADSIVLRDGSVFEAEPGDARGVGRSLMNQYRMWRGTPYQLGGSTREGIDCSAFVQITFQEHFGVSLPRNTTAQARVGEAVDRASIRTGDLLFFRTGPTRRHVGIYLGKGQFLHASTRVGVTIARLDDAYWQRAYWSARRVM